MESLFRGMSPEVVEWAHLDSNQGPTDYESAALTRLSYGPERRITERHYSHAGDFPAATPHGQTRVLGLSQRGFRTLQRGESPATIEVVTRTPLVQGYDSRRTTYGWRQAMETRRRNGS